jgi:CO/xanthine dehydrogenase FAD-binding subunit
LVAGDQAGVAKPLEVLHQYGEVGNVNLHSVTAVHRPRSFDEIGPWRPGEAWLAGGTWLFSEPQWAIDTLIDLDRLAWPALSVAAAGLEIAATCRIAELARFKGPAAWRAQPLLLACCESLLASFKIWNVATVGGNICMSLPAGAMIALAVALEGVLTLWPRGGPPRRVAAVDFVTGDHANVLRPGELLRAIHLPATALARRFAWRRASLTQLGRSAALLIGTRDEAGGLLLTITAATPRPVQLRFATSPSAAALRAALEAEVPDGGWFDDVNGSPAYKRHVSRYFAEQIRAELAKDGP